MNEHATGRLRPDPIERFARLFAQARETEILEPTAMTLATVGEDGRPSTRVVLLKAFDARGFVFYTNLQSRKARELRQYPFAALSFYWDRLEVQVRIEGRAEQVSNAESDAYFATRPRGSQIGAWASLQSSPLPVRTELEQRVRDLEERFAGQDVPRPPFWSGFRILPECIEFWLGQPDRLHVRDVYTRDTRAEGGWRIEQLYP